MRKARLVVWCLFTLVLLLLPAAITAHPQTDVTQAGGTIRAYMVEKTHYAEGQWHYGAYFHGKEGYWQHYKGPGGDAATAPYSGGIANWGWWGTFYNALSVPKTFLYLHPFSAWDGNNYEASFMVVW